MLRFCEHHAADRRSQQEASTDLAAASAAVAAAEQSLSAATKEERRLWAEADAAAVRAAKLAKRRRAAEKLLAAALAASRAPGASPCRRGECEAAAAVLEELDADTAGARQRLAESEPRAAAASASAQRLAEVTHAAMAALLAAEATVAKAAASEASVLDPAQATLALEAAAFSDAGGEVQRAGLGPQQWEHAFLAQLDPALLLHVAAVRGCGCPPAPLRTMHHGNCRLFSSAGGLRPGDLRDLPASRARLQLPTPHAFCRAPPA